MAEQRLLEGPGRAASGQGLRRNGLSLFRAAGSHSAPRSPLGQRLGGKGEEMWSFLAS